MHNFFVHPSSIKADQVTLTGEVARQIARVLRLRAGDEIVILDYSGYEYLVFLHKVSSTTVHGLVKERRWNQSEPTTRVTLYQGMLKSDKFEFVLQKGTELGVTEFVPILCERSIARAVGELTRSRRNRWERIIVEASEQAGRGKLPTLSDPVSFDTACEDAPGLKVIPWENESVTKLRSVLNGNPGGVSIFIGPEGGLTAKEVETAGCFNITPVTLGPRVLRAETAAITAVAAVMYESGEL